MFRVWRPRDGDGWRGDGAFQFERLYVKVTPWRLVLLASGVGAYLAGLLVFLPAEAALGDERDVVGTVWKGEAALEPGFAAGWSTRPFSSLASLSGVADVGVRGPDTDITGNVSVRPTGAVIRRMEGAGSMRLLNALAPIALAIHILVLRRDADHAAGAVFGMLAWGGMIMGAYGVLQYLSPPPWDVAWMRAAEIASVGQPSPRQVRVFGT